MLVLALVVLVPATAAIVWLIAQLNQHLDQRSDAWRRNHAHKRRWYE